MFIKIAITALCILLINLVTPQFAFAFDGSEKEARLIEKVKTGIAKLGIGPEAKVELKLKDGRKLKGHVTEINDDNFSVMDSKTGQSVSVSYPQVKQVKGNNLSKKTIITIGIIGIFVLLLVVFQAQRENT